MKQLPFLCAEIEQDGSVVAATGKRGWSCFSVTERVLKVQRFSVQRAFCEVQLIPLVHGAGNIYQKYQI